jgi:hypothetical protein
MIQLAACIQDLSCMVGSNGDIFLRDKLQIVFESAKQIVDGE